MLISTVIRCRCHLIQWLNTDRIPENLSEMGHTIYSDSTSYYIQWLNTDRIPEKPVRNGAYNLPRFYLILALYCTEESQISVSLSQCFIRSHDENQHLIRVYSTTPEPCQEGPRIQLHMHYILHYNYIWFSFSLTVAYKDQLPDENTW